MHTHMGTCEGQGFDLTYVFARWQQAKKESNNSTNLSLSLSLGPGIRAMRATCP